ncbi:class I SAM-dependent methyltransferase [Pseudorhodoplanes sp.]|jgi:NADH dehydrogenase [ubiquinone] 1 alpha subcomplex assembly factor 7|uniref:class I SAM-dependent methyltransferase n=1 Tax=Pseudorhodoplanes sp. TaxID=1934341 RepID=UPI002D1C9F8B|nr:SAM-dependent methyltransferase [Pseudorhodoplanes sp.]HWV41114.1 SAM-dependent methyltransferase [Pseudorhodoplanes sp.]
MSEPSPLEKEIRRLIAVSGPMPIARYMSLCLTHPKYGYYITRDPFGADGDFTTSPEISQTFGELLGLWALSVWRMLGEPEPVQLIELGPGRGTMMRDALRAAKVLPKFRDALSVQMVEISPTLERLQRENLKDFDVPIRWHRDLESVPEGPSIILANEYVDALPVHQVVKQSDGWHERVVGLNANGDFALGLAPDPLPRFERFMPKKIKDAPVGAIFEWRNDIFAFDIARRVRNTGAALLIDYGHIESDLGETLQAVNAHNFSDPLLAPGMADITAHVDFAAFGEAAAAIGAAIHGPVTQARFLRELGIDARGDALRRGATDEQAANITKGIERLTEAGKTGMGELFKVLAISDPKLDTLPGFAPA